MFQLNPHGLLDAWWQHLLMVGVSAVIGYIIGYRNGYRTIHTLEDQLARSGVDLEKCRKSLVALVPPATAITDDDLTIIEGIGPKIEKLLKQAGITSYSQLSTASADRLQHILHQAGLQLHDATTWPRQALMARDGKWEELKLWQQQLDGGKE